MITIYLRNCLDILKIIQLKVKHYLTIDITIIEPIGSFLIGFGFI